MTDDATGTGEDDHPETPAEGADETDGEGEADGTDGAGEADESSESGSEVDEVASMYDQSPGVGGDDLLSAEDDADEAENADVPADASANDETAESDDPDQESGLGAPLLGDDDDSPELESGTFYVKHTEETAVTLHEVNTTQIYTLIQNPGLRAHDLIEATLMAQPPMEVSYVIHELHERWNVPIEVSSEPPTRQVQKAVAEMDTMQAVALDREGEGEIHVLSVDPENVERTVEELADDEMTYKNAARYGVERVEIRTDEEAGIVSIRYLP